MSRRVSLLIIAATVIAIGFVFFRVIWPLIPPLFFAGMLAILFWPVYEKVVTLFRGHRRWAALATTVGIVGIVVLPLAGMLTLAGIQLVDVGENLVKAGQDIVTAIKQNQQGGEGLEAYPMIQEVDAFLRENVSADIYDTARQMAEDSLGGITRTIYQQAINLVGGVLTFVIGLAIMLLSLYYAFADGPKLVSAVRKLSPLNDAEEVELYNNFDRVCRGVVLGTLVSALVQGALAGIGFTIVGVGWVWMLMVLTMFFAMIPFLGAASVWISVALVLAFEGSWWKAGFIVVYGGGVVSLSDNFVRAYVLHNRANMHPLIAFVTVIGALQVIGLWGIFVGPLTAAFFFFFVKTLQHRLLDSKEGDQSDTGEESAGTEPLANDQHDAPPDTNVEPDEDGRHNRKQ